jgi:hypothetical protein
MQICGYGCGRIAKYRPRKGMKKWCCEVNIQSCPSLKKINSEKQNGKIQGISEKIITTQLCEYGCNNIAKFKIRFKHNEKFCCEKTPQKCPERRKKISEKHMGHSYTKGIKRDKKFSETMRIIMIDRFKNDQDYIDKYIESRKKLKRTINKISKKYPFFTKIEEMQYNPKKEIQVRCKNHKCKNSKEKNGWFIPTGRQLEHRIAALEHPRGNGGAYFYCSEKCKNECPLYGLQVDPYKKIEAPFSQEEYKIFRQEVLKRQIQSIGYNECEICGERSNLHIHHEKPKKIHPLFSLDPDNGLIFCIQCHYKRIHKGDCSVGKLAKIQCK